jgi:hypothetical protein
MVKLQSSYVDELRVDQSRKYHLQQQNLKTNGQADRGDEKLKMIARVRYTTFTSSTQRFLVSGSC